MKISAKTAKNDEFHAENVVIQLFFSNFSKFDQEFEKSDEKFTILKVFRFFAIAELKFSDFPLKKCDSAHFWRKNCRKLRFSIISNNLHADWKRRQRRARQPPFWENEWKLVENPAKTAKNDDFLAENVVFQSFFKVSEAKF